MAHWEKYGYAVYMDGIGTDIMRDNVNDFLTVLCRGHTAAELVKSSANTANDTFQVYNF